MLRLEQLDLVQFRNHPSRNYRFDGRVVAISGKNGSGKTGILDAIHFLSFTRSFFHHQDQLSVTHGSQGMRITGTLIDDTPFRVQLILRETGRKEMLVDHEVVKRFSSHLGRIPLVMITPDDIDLILGGSELRRRFIDMCISQVNSTYTEHLMSYNKVLQQRNAALKKSENLGASLHNLLDTYDALLWHHGKQIYAQRVTFIERIVPLCRAHYAELSEGQEEIHLAYLSAMHDADFENQLAQSRSKDILLQRTSLGIHRDDLRFELDGYLMKQVASQGQKKSFLFSLKWAQHHWLQEQTGKQPILLLDDIFEKLDAKRSEQLMERIRISPAQVFLTDTHADRIESALHNCSDRVHLYL